MLEILVGVAVVVGMAGIFLPILPGTLLIAGAIGLWAAVEQVWWLLGAVVVLAAAAMALSLVIPARAARDAASTKAMAVGAVAALVGLFVIPVVGAPVGFLAGVFGTEAARLRDANAAWSATWSTTKSIGLAMVVELVAALLMAGLWAAALIAT